MKTSILILTLAALALLSMPSCVTRHKPPMVRTTTSVPEGRFGAGTTSVTETPYESPAYREAATAMFARP